MDVYIISTILSGMVVGGIIGALLKAFRDRNAAKKGLKMEMRAETYYVLLSA